MQNIALNLEDEMGLLRQKIKYTLDIGKEIFLVTDYAGYVKHISEEVFDILHFDAICMLSKNIADYTSLKGKDKFKEILELVNQKPQEQLHLDSIELKCKFNENHFFDVLVCKKELDEGNAFLFYLLDVTDKVKAVEKIDTLNFELDNFIYKTSHDLRAPLLSVLGLLNLIEKDENEFEPKGTYQKLIRKSIERLDRYITQLSHYERIKNEEPKIKNIDLKSTILKIIKDYKNLYGADNVKVLINIPEDIEFGSDQFKVEVILNNILSNAIKYHNIEQAHPFINVQVKEINDSISISIADNGVGISDDNLDTVFKMFSRGTHLSDGSGLGLYLANQAATKIGGSIKIRSKVDIGTHLLITLPNLKITS